MSYFFNRINSSPLEAGIPFNNKLPLKTKLISISNVTEIFNVKGTPHVHVPLFYLEKKTVSYSNYRLAGLSRQSINPDKKNIPIVLGWTRSPYDRPVSNNLTDWLAVQSKNYKTINLVNSKLKNCLNVKSVFNLRLTDWQSLRFSNSKIRKIKNNQFKNIFLYFFKEIFYMDCLTATSYSKNSYLIFSAPKNGGPRPPCRTDCTFLAKNTRKFSVFNNGLAVLLGNNKQEPMLKKPIKYYNKQIKKTLLNNVLKKQINIKKLINNYKNLFNILNSYSTTVIPLDSQSVSSAIFDYYTFPKRGSSPNSKELNFLNSAFTFFLKQIDVNKINNLNFFKSSWTGSPLGPTAYNIKRFLKYYINDITYLIFFKLLKRILLSDNYSFLIYLKTSWLSIKNLIKKSANQTSTILLVFINLYYRFLKFLSFYYFNLTLQYSSCNLKAPTVGSQGEGNANQPQTIKSMFYKKNIDNLFLFGPAGPATNNYLNKNQMISISLYKKTFSYYIFRAADCQPNKNKLNVLDWITNQPEPMFISFNIEKFSWLSNYYTDSQMIEQPQFFNPFCISHQVQRAEDIPVSIFLKNNRFSFPKKISSAPFFNMGLAGSQFIPSFPMQPLLIKNNKQNNKLIKSEKTPSIIRQIILDNYILFGTGLPVQSLLRYSRIYQSASQSRVLNLNESQNLLKKILSFLINFNDKNKFEEQTKILNFYNSSIYYKLSMNPTSSQKSYYENNENKCYPFQKNLIKQLWLLKKKKHNNRSLFWLFKKYFLKTTFREFLFNSIYGFPEKGPQNIKKSLILKTHRLFFKNLLVIDRLSVQSPNYLIKLFKNLKITELKKQNRALVVFNNPKNEFNYNCQSVTRFLFLKKISQLAIFCNYKRNKRLFKCQSTVCEKQLLLYTFSIYNN